MSNEAKSNINIKEVKVVLIGDSGVGKTSIIQQFSKNEFNPYSNPSISSQFSTKEFKIPDSKITIKYDLWDTAGQEIYRSLAKIFFKDAKIIILVYEIGNKNSFESLQNYWYQEVISNSSSNPILAVVGNKNDLYDIPETVDEKKANDWADKIGAIFMTISAKKDIGIDLLFEKVGKKFLDPNFDDKSEEEKIKQKFEKKKDNKILTKDNDDDGDEEDINNESIKISRMDFNNKKKKFCC